MSTVDLVLHCYLIHLISVIKFCENEVEDGLKVINPTKAAGPDFINHRLLKEAAPIIKYPLWKTTRTSLPLFNALPKSFVILIS
jgi:hypothetical protein